MGLLGLLAPVACSFNGSGVGATTEPDVYLIEGPLDVRTRDTTKGGAPVPDGPRDVDVHVDVAMKHDRGPAKDLPVVPDLPKVKPDMVLTQGTRCQSGSNTITADKVPKPGAWLEITVASAAASWVMAGVSADQQTSPAKGSFTWIGGVTSEGIKCNRKNTWCQWTFPKVMVPHKPGPYTFGFMVGATGDQWQKGHIVFTCVP